MGFCHLITDSEHLWLTEWNRPWSRGKIRIRTPATRRQFLWWQMGRSWYTILVLCRRHTQFNRRSSKRRGAQNTNTQLIAFNLLSLTAQTWCHQFRESNRFCHVVLQCGRRIWIEAECWKPCWFDLLLRWILIDYTAIASHRYRETVLVVVSAASA